jgi:hypothetical protein
VNLWPVPAQSGLETRRANLGQRSGSGDRKVLRVPCSQRRPGGIFTPESMTIRLQPQMKKYRCLWYMSTTNHNILYFVAINGINFPNKGNYLWKAPKLPAEDGVQAVEIPPAIASPGSENPQRRSLPGPAFSLIALPGWQRGLAGSSNPGNAITCLVSCAAPGLRTPNGPTRDRVGPLGGSGCPPARSGTVWQGASASR